MAGYLKQVLYGTDGSADFLQPRYMANVCAALQFPAAIKEAFVAEAERIRNDAGLTDSARRFHRELFLDRLPSDDINKRLLDVGNGMFSAAVYLGAIPQLFSYYEQRGIPESILIDTVQDMLIWMEHHRKKHGAWGLSQLNWLILHMRGELFRLGRLQFHFIANPLSVKTFRHKRSGDMACLSDSGVRYRADGQVDGTSDIHDPDGGWLSQYEFDGVRHTGNPITRLGVAGREPVSLSESEWELVLQKGDIVLNVHIPEGSRMAHEACRDSYEQAHRFATESFPVKDYKAFVCQSWLLAPQFRELLPAESNIVRFQSDYHLVPIKSNEDQTLERVYGFGTKLADLPNVPKETSLQRIVSEYLASGGHIHNGAGFIMRA